MTSSPDGWGLELTRLHRRLILGHISRSGSGVEQLRWSQLCGADFVNEKLHIEEYMKKINLFDHSQYSLVPPNLFRHFVVYFCMLRSSTSRQTGIVSDIGPLTKTAQCSPNASVENDFAPSPPAASSPPSDSPSGITNTERPNGQRLSQKFKKVSRNSPYASSSVARRTTASVTYFTGAIGMPSPLSTGTASLVMGVST